MAKLTRDAFIEALKEMTILEITRIAKILLFSK